MAETRLGKLTHSTWVGSLGERGPILTQLCQVATLTGDSCLDTITPNMRSIAITWLQVCQPWKK